MNTSELILFDKDLCKECACTVCNLACTEKCVQGYENPCDRCERKIEGGEITSMERKPLLACTCYNDKGKRIHAIVPDDWKE